MDTTAHNRGQDASNLADDSGGGAPAARPPIAVLIADDEGYVRALIGAVLRRAGMRVWLAAGGDEAVAILREHGGAIDVALLDVQMPGVGGPEALRRMRELRPGLPCVFMTGDAGPHDQQGLLALAGRRVLYKPFAVDEVVSAVREAAG
jgi:two-component system OmpR family response regulator